jgi:N-acetylneuraminic acid mutarotase
VTGLVAALASGKVQVATWALAAAAASWMSGTPLPEPRSEVAAAPLSGRIVVVGGFLESGANSRRVDAYDPASDKWERLPDFPVSVDHAAAASANGRLVVVGGYDADRQPLRAAFLFDGTRWRRLPAPPEERAAAAATATRGGIVWVVGGRTRDGLATTMLRLDLRTLRWRTLPGPRPREHLAATALGGRVYAIGGRRAGYDSNLATVQVFDPHTDRWRSLPDLPAPRGGTGAAAIGGRLVSVGGESPQGTESAVWALRPSSRRWVRLPDLPTPRHGLGVVALRGRVWVVAGGPKPGLTVSGALESLPLARPSG